MEGVTAAQYVARVWSAAIPTYMLPRSQQRVVHFPQAFEQDALLALSLPLADARPDSQTVALANRQGFQREKDEKTLQIAYEEEPRTRIYEHINRQPSDNWYRIVTMQLRRVARCKVYCSVYESNAGDQSLGEHVDKWLGLIVQMRGSKAWTFPLGDVPDQKILTHAGDILLIPQDIRHAVSTPSYSAHITFALDTNKPD